MKTITLTDEAYERLKDWKTADSQDSFSKVVLRVVPQRGTLSEMIDNLKRLPPLTEQQTAVMENTISWANDWGNVNDPWSEAQVQTPTDEMEA